MLDSLKKFEEAEEAMKRPRVGAEDVDVVYSDHRDSNCSVSPKAQGLCSSCYAFPTVAIAKWADCKETGELVAFSEQYILQIAEN